MWQFWSKGWKIFLICFSIWFEFHKLQNFAMSYMAIPCHDFDIIRFPSWTQCSVGGRWQWIWIFRRILCEEYRRRCLQSFKWNFPIRHNLLCFGSLECDVYCVSLEKNYGVYTVKKCFDGNIFFFYLISCQLLKISLNIFKKKFFVVILD